MFHVKPKPSNDVIDLEANKNKGGRPTKLTPELIASFADIMRRGNYAECACGINRISHDSYQRWIDQGEIDLSAGEIDTLQARFCVAVKEASALAEADAVAGMVHGGRNWVALATFLERRFRDRWGRSERVAITGANGGAVEHKQTIDMTGMTDAQLEAVAALYRQQTVTGNG